MIMGYVSAESLDRTVSQNILASLTANSPGLAVIRLPSGELKLMDSPEVTTLHVPELKVCFLLLPFYITEVGPMVTKALNIFLLQFIAYINLIKTIKL